MPHLPHLTGTPHTLALAAGLAEGGGGAAEVRGHRSVEGAAGRRGAAQWPVGRGRREEGRRRTCAGRLTVVGSRLRRAAVARLGELHALAQRRPPRALAVKKVH